MADVSPPRKPRMVLRVGVVGARDLTLAPDGEADPHTDAAAADRWREQRADRQRAMVKTLEPVVADLLDRIYAILERARPPVAAASDEQVYSDEPPQVRLVSGLADGADQLVSRVGWAGRRGTDRFALLAILPFPRETYVAETVEDRAGFQALIGHAEQVIEPDTQYTPLPFPGRPDAPQNAAPRRNQHAGFRLQATLLLLNADLLFVLWDPTRQGKAGGTEETLRAGLRRGVAAVWVNPRNPTAPVLLTSEDQIEWSLAGEPQPGAPTFGDALRDYVERLMSFAEPVHRRWWSPVRWMEPTPRRMLKEVFAATPPGRSHVYRRAWKGVTALADLLGRVPRPGWAPPPVVEPYHSYYDRADKLADLYGNHYRGAFLLNYVCGLSAVVMASVMAVSRDPDANRWLGALELTLIGVVLFNTVAARVKDWHARLLDYRLVAELFRQMCYLARAGLGPPIYRLSALTAEEADGHGAGPPDRPRQHWTTVLFHAVLRSRPAVVTPAGGAPVTVPYTRGELLTLTRHVRADWIEGQISYHETISARMGTMYRWTERVNWLLFLATAGLAGYHALEAWRPAAGHAGPDWFVFGCIVLPATALTLNGFRYQAEARRLQERSRSMAQRLEGYGTRFARIEDALARPGSAAIREAIDEMGALAQAMIDEVADWRMVYRMHEISAA